LANRPLRQNLTSRLRSLSPRRSVIVEGVPSSWSDIYHTSMLVSWPVFLGALAGLFVFLNLVFGALFAAQPGSIANADPNDYTAPFFFSVETLSTTGYGDMHPQTLYGHTVATLEIFVSLVATAAMTGLVFARFSRPRSRLVFARHPVVTRHDGVDTLMLRVANARHSFLSEATAKLWWLGPIVTAEGTRFVGFLPMRLLRAENPALSLSWTLFHPIDEASPLYGRSAADIIADDVNLVLSIAGVDETSSQSVHSRHVYASDDLNWGHQFVDMFRRDENERMHVDFSKIHLTHLPTK
jgi:inward rectifier potassium channel